MHCYRIVGSVQDAEDALQETLLTAWQSIGKFEGRSSIRTWLYQVATSRCLNMLRAGRRRVLTETMLRESDLPQPTRLGEVVWLEPYPDSLLEGIADTAPGPEARYDMREAISLAFITALQLLPPRQRAVQILRDVLGFRASEVAQMLDSTEEAVTSALKRARATLQTRNPDSSRAGAPPPAGSPAEQALVDRFARAFEYGDVDDVVALLTRDVWFTMPPLPFEYSGRDLARQVLAIVLAPGRKLIATRANTQPAFGVYLPDAHRDTLSPVGLLVLTLSPESISAIARFELTALEQFQLPQSLPGAPSFR